MEVETSEFWKERDLEYRRLAVVQSSLSEMRVLANRCRSILKEQTCGKRVWRWIDRTTAITLRALDGLQTVTRLLLQKRERKLRDDSMGAVA